MKHKIRIFAFPSHGTEYRVSGVDFARIIQPMEHLSKHPDFDIHIFNPKEKMNWLEVAEKYDIIYFNYLNDAWGFAHMKIYAKHHKTKLVLDVDDALWSVLPDNQAHKVYKRGSEGIKNFTTICNEVDYMTTTSRYLKNIIRHETNQKEIKVFPNYIDLDLYSHRSKFKDTHEIVLLHFGSTTHFIDLEENEFVLGIDKIMKEYPNVKLITVGAMMPKLKKMWGMRYENAFGDVDVYGWIKEKFPYFMDNSDIMVVPLKESTYTKAKSSIKFLEMSSAKKPGVYQDIRQYREAVKNTGFLAKTSEDWYQSIKKLIDDKELRKQMGENAFNEVKKNWQCKDHIEDYAKWFSMVDKS